MAEQKGTPARDIEKEIGELEERVDRLRVLYEQYFLGFEKLEPSVPRKEVDRRFVLLRKENIRNTALRYRFNVVNQKYNTYAMHWTRICRQIEEGTFKRHVKKAQERFGDGSDAQAARRRAKEQAETGFDVDIDFEDLDAMDMDSVLEEADRAAAKYERPAAIDTVPPASAPPSAPKPAPSQPIERVARPAPLPAGAGSKPKLIRKVVKGPGESAPIVGASSPPDSVPTPGPRAAPQPSPSGSIRGPMPSAPSAGRMPIAAPPPQSERRLPLPAGPPGIPVGPTSERRMPVSPPGAANRPMIRPAIRPATQSRPDLDPSSDRPSQPQPHAQPQSAPRAPVAPPARAPGTPPASQPRAPVPAPAPSRPRAPLPLPSQLNRDEKK